MAGHVGIRSWWFTAGALVALSCCAAATATTPAGSLECSTVTALLADCAAFVTHGDPVPAGTPFCDGETGPYAVAADSADNWRSVCSCLRGLVTTYRSNASAVAQLPALCGISLGFTIGPNRYCLR